MPSEDVLPAVAADDEEHPFMQANRHGDPVAAMTGRFAVLGFVRVNGVRQGLFALPLPAAIEPDEGFGRGSGRVAAGGSGERRGHTYHAGGAVIMER